MPLYTCLYNGYLILFKFIAPVLVLFESLGGSAFAEVLNIAVAANFITAMERLEQSFEQQSGHEIQIIRGSSGKHYAQISNGAPFDVFLSADQLRPRRLIEEGLAEESSLATYALGQLALWSRQSGLGLDSDYLLNTDNYGVISIANPRLAPYGQAATEVFNKLGLESLKDERLVMGENIAQAFQFAFSGNADLGLVAYSQTLSKNLRGRGSVWLVPSTLYRPIRQDMVILKASEAASEFSAFMGSDVAREILIDSGYLLPEAAH